MAESNEKETKKKTPAKKASDTKSKAKASTAKKTTSKKTDATSSSKKEVVKKSSAKKASSEASQASEQRTLSKKVHLRRQKLSVKLKAEGLKVPKAFTYGTGRRKSSIAKVWLFPGSGQVKINNLDVKQYLTRDVLVGRALMPLEKLELKDKYDVKITVLGGGLSGQADACKMGIARAILGISEDYRKSLREGSFLTRDMREKERKKYGKRGARKAPQYRKR